VSPILGILASGITGNLAPSTIELLVVGGGASILGYPIPGATGGGGAGGYLTATPAVTKGTTYTITVGAASNSSSWNGTITALAGGTASGNGGWSNGSGPGGSGGAGTPGQGYAGGAASDVDGVNAGGGGGAGGAGGNSSSGGAGKGAAGPGVSNSISGTAVTYCVGGGGGGYGQGTSSSTYGSGAPGCDYNGAYFTYGQQGVVILRYPDTFQAAASTTGSPTVTVAGGYRVYSFANNGSITF